MGAKVLTKLTDLINGAGRMNGTKINLPNMVDMLHWLAVLLCYHITGLIMEKTIALLRWHGSFISCLSPVTCWSDS